MCRLAFYTPKTTLSLKTIENHFEYLEQCCGGHGNGIAVVDHEGRVLDLKKRINLTTKRCAKIAQRAVDNGQYAIFHTRLVSVGKRSNRQCHPHLVSGEYWNGVLAHNGTWREGTTLAGWLNLRRGDDPRALSDTETYAYLLGKIGESMLSKYHLLPTSGVWLFGGINSDGAPDLRIEMLSGDLRFSPQTHCWASDFPWSLKHHYRVKLGVYSAENIPPQEQVIVKQRFDQRFIDADCWSVR